MEVYKEPSYHYTKVLMFPTAGAKQECSGTVEIEVMEGKGRLIYYPGESLRNFLEANPLTRLSLFICKNEEGPDAQIGRVTIKNTSEDLCQWEFNTKSYNKRAAKEGLFFYRILVAIASEGGFSGKEGQKVLALARLGLPFEIRDARVLGFKKEMKVEKNACAKTQSRNPLFQKVEPFEPLIPNSIWWQISVQPEEYDHGLWQAEYCPRRKPHKAAF